jgi:SAM-dependent methyltransferase
MVKQHRAELTRVTGRGRRLWAVPVLASLIATIVVWRRGTAMRAEGWRWYGLVYRTAYFLGLKVWDRRRPMSDLVELVEGPSPPPPGRALDIGCGTGTDSIYLAQHGWDVTGVDMVPRALAIAHRRAEEAGVSLRFVEGDVALLVDFGCFHTIPPDRRDAYVESVSKVAAPGSTFLLFGFARPPRLAPMEAGFTAEEVRERFNGHRWNLVSAEPVSTDALKVAGDRVDRRFELWRYDLRRLSS